MRNNRFNSRALWTLVGSLWLISAAQPTASGLEFPMTTSISLPASANLTMSVALNTEVDLSEGAALYTQLDKRTNLFASQMALAAAISWDWCNIRIEVQRIHSCLFSHRIVCIWKGVHGLVFQQRSDHEQNLHSK